MKAFLLVIAFVLLSIGAASAGTRVAPVSQPVPTLMPWGMVGTAAAMGLSGFYFLFKRKK